MLLHTAADAERDTDIATPAPWLSVLDPDPDWNALFYHQVMGAQQLAQALALLPSVGDLNDCMCVDAGCGSGLLAEAILQRFPRVQMLGMDISENMLNLARRQVPATPRVRWVQMDLQDFCMPNTANAIVSNAAMHWVPDHQRMFANLYTTLLPGGVLAAQFVRRGPFFDKLHAYLNDQLMQREPFASILGNHAWAAEQVSVAYETRTLEAAGFMDIHVTPYHCVFHFETREVQRKFIAEVIMRDAMQRLPSAALRHELLQAVLTFTDAEVGRCKQHYESIRCLARRSLV